MVSRSDNFNIDWFLDGRRRKPSSDYVIPPGTAVTVTPMNAGDGSGGKVPRIDEDAGWALIIAPGKKGCVRWNDRTIHKGSQRSNL